MKNLCIRIHIQEFLLISSFVLLMLGFFNERKDYIHSDGAGYYDYLPSTFIRKDIIRYNKPRELFPKLYKTLEQQNFYRNFEEKWVNKYYCGTACMVLPSFLVTLSARKMMGYSDSGYEFPYQLMLLLTALVWLLIGLVYLRKSLQLLNVNWFYILIIQAATLFATPFTIYAWFDASYSHVFSFALVSILVFYVLYFTETKDIKYLKLACLAFGFIIILRPINVLVCLSIPLIIDKYRITEALNSIKSKLNSLLTCCLLLFLPIGVQSMFWLLQTGEYYLYSYQNEGFDFLNPQLSKLLFSYQKGLFVYTPFLAAFFLITLSIITSKNWRFITYFLMYFLGVSYVFSSWWCWFYGSSYGQRVFLDYLPILFLPIKLANPSPKLVYRSMLLVILFLSIILNLIQTWQYQHYILHWDQMNKEKYWRVFLRTSNPYMGWVWKEKTGAATTKSFQPHQSISYYSKGAPSDTILKLSGYKFNALENGAEFRISLNHHFPHEYQGQIALFAIDTLTQEKLFWEQKQLLQFCNGRPGDFQTGDYWFKPKPTKKLNAAICYLVVYHLPLNDSLKNLKIQIIPPNP